MSTPIPEHPGLAGLAARESMSARITRAADDDADHVRSVFPPMRERELLRRALTGCGCCGRCDCACHRGGGS